MCMYLYNTECCTPFIITVIVTVTVRYWFVFGSLSIFSLFSSGHKRDLPGLVIAGCNAGDKNVEFQTHKANNSLTVNESYCIR